jgi:cytochrome bd ubiquinol oxidase subunit II
VTVETFWFTVLTFMLVMYVVLDGFDIGAGAIHLFVARHDSDRKAILKSIGPVWDGNEVWLVAGGGVLFMAFPKVYASSFSGFYLPLMIVLWLLMLRGIGIELRGHIDQPLWRSFWDAVFSISSLLLAIFFGAALGNVVRGVPLDAEGRFFEPLWTTFTVVPEAGILDWYTVLMGLVALATLVLHGANFISLKTEGDVQGNARSVSTFAAPVVAILSVIALGATNEIRPSIWNNYLNHFWGSVFPVLGLSGIVGTIVFRKRQQDLQAFLSSAAFIVGMGAATAFGLYPRLLPASTNPLFDLTIGNTASGAYALSVAAAWWCVGFVLILVYFTYLYYSFRGKVDIADDAH